MTGRCEQEEPSSEQVAAGRRRLRKEARPEVIFAGHDDVVLFLLQ